MLLKPFVESLGGDRTAWLALAMSSTLAGNLTLIGSVANLIVVQQARRNVEIGFMEYFRVGAVITAATIAIGILVLALEVRVAHGAEAGAAGKPEKQMMVTVVSPGTAAAARTFRVVLVCDTIQKREQGLQGFRPLMSGEAALFVFDKPEPVSFWMGSVAFPIDIIFVSLDKEVVRIYPSRRPGSLGLYPSGGPVKWVIETAAGSGIRAGDKISIK